MVSEGQALSAWQDVLEEAIGVDEAAIVVDRVGDVATRRDLEHLSGELDAKLDRLRIEFDGKLTSLAHELKGAWRRDLLMIAIPQLVGLAAIFVNVAG